MSTIYNKAVKIRNEKEEKLLPENIKKDVKIYGVTGTLEEGIDTSDATASATDIALNKTAYVNDEKITGSLLDLSGAQGAQFIISGNLTNHKYNNKDYIGAYSKVLFDNDVIVRRGFRYDIDFPHDKIAQALNLTPDQIKENETVLGITGTYSGLDTSDANASAGDIAFNKTAYVNGQKITGTIPVIGSGQSIEYGEANTVEEKTNTVNIKHTQYEDTIIKENALPEFTIPKADLAQEINLTANKIKKDEVILGITGTYEGESQVLPDINITLPTNNIQKGYIFTRIELPEVTGADYSNMTLFYDIYGKDSETETKLSIEVNQYSFIDYDNDNDIYYADIPIGQRFIGEDLGTYYIKFYPANLENKQSTKSQEISFNVIEATQVKAWINFIGLDESWLTIPQENISIVDNEGTSISIDEYYDSTVSFTADLSKESYTTTIIYEGVTYSTTTSTEGALDEYTLHDQILGIITPDYSNLISGKKIINLGVPPNFILSRTYDISIDGTEIDMTDIIDDLTYGINIKIYDDSENGNTLYTLVVKFTDRYWSEEEERYNCNTYQDVVYTSIDGIHFNCIGIGYPDEGTTHTYSELYELDIYSHDVHTSITVPQIDTILSEAVYVKYEE